jgi:hypothetical protein
MKGAVLKLLERYIRIIALRINKSGHPKYYIPSRAEQGKCYSGSGAHSEGMGFHQALSKKGSNNGKRSNGTSG